jgi:2-hydroxymuconate-semialdehyde hydrolase
VPAIQRDHVVVDGFETSYLVSGAPSAPLLVLLHDGAWGGSAEASWWPLIPTFAERYRVIAPDLFGYGSSSKMVRFDVAPYEFRLRQVAGLLDALGHGDRTAHFVGNSFGGAMALRGTIEPWFEWRMRSATSIAGTGGPFRTKESLVALAQFDGTREDMLRIVRLLTDDFDSIDAHVDLRLRDASDPAHYRAVASAGLQTPFSSVRAADPYPESLRDARVPVAVVTGLRDTLVEPAWAHEIARHAPLGAVYEIDGRHSPNIDRPDETARLLLHVLAESERVGDGGRHGQRLSGVM